MKRLLLLTSAFLSVFLSLVACQPDIHTTPSQQGEGEPVQSTSPALAPYESTPTSIPPTSIPTVETRIAPTPTATLVPPPTASLPEQAAVSPTESMPSPAGAIAVPEACPKPTADTRVLVNRLGGYCLLYPDTHTALRTVYGSEPTSTIHIFAESILSQAPFVFLSTEDAAGQDPAQVAQAIADQLAEFDVELAEIEVAGQPAFMLTNLPGQAFTREVIFEHGGMLYKFSFLPDDFAGTDYARQLTTFADVLLNSLTFIPVSETMAVIEDCMQPRPDEQLIISEALGFCLLVPSSYTYDPDGQDRATFHGGSVVDADHPRLIIEVSATGNRSAYELTDKLFNEVTPPEDLPVEIHVFTLGDDNITAKMVDNVPGEYPGRVMLFDHGERRYRLTFMPYDPAQFEFTGAMGTLIHLVTQSFRFLP